MLGPFFISVLVFTVVLLLGRVLQLTEMVLTRGVSIGSVGYLILAILPFVFVFTLPMSSLLSVLLAFLRMSSESEITAMKNAGLSLYQLLTPVIVFSLLLYGATSALAFFALPWGNYALKLQLIELARTKADIAIKESVFNNAFDKVVIYMRSYNHKERLMEDVLISDERDPSVTNTIVAPRGYLLNHPDGSAITIRLYNGSISRVDKKMDLTQNISFERYDVNLDLKGLSQFSNRNKKGKEMTYGEMLTAMKDLAKDDPRARAIKIELQKKFVFPLSCLVMGLLGVPLGLQATNRRRSTGVLLGLFSFLVYYTLLSITLNLGEMQNFPIVLGMWTPNILFGILALYMLRKSAQESPIAVVEKVNEWAEGIMEKIRKIRS